MNSSNKLEELTISTSIDYNTNHECLCELGRWLSDQFIRNLSMASGVLALISSIYQGDFLKSTNSQTSLES
jgi:hypothetical protein